MAREVGALVALLVSAVWLAYALAPRAEDVPIPALIHPMVAGGLVFFLFPFRRRVACSRGVVVALGILGVWLAARMSLVWAPFLGAFVLTYLLRFLSHELQALRLPRGHVIHMSSRTANYIILGSIVGFLALSVFVIVPGFIAQMVQLVDGTREAYVRGLLYQSTDVPLAELTERVADGGRPLLAAAVDMGAEGGLESGAAVTPADVAAMTDAGLSSAPIQRTAYLVELYENAGWLRDFIEEGAEAGGITQTIVENSEARLMTAVAGLGDVFTTLLDGSRQLLSGAVGFLATTVFTLIVLSYLLKSYDNYLSAGLMLFPVASWERVQHVAHGVDKSLQAFLRGQALIVLAIAFLSAAAYGLCGIPFALLMGVIGGLLNTIPNVGPALAGIVAAGALLVGAVTGTLPDILLFIEAPGMKGFLIRAALIPVAIFVVQSVDNAFISPRVMSRAVSIDPLMILGSVLVGGTIFGFWGIMLAIPALVVAKSVWENWDEPAVSMTESHPPSAHDDDPVSISLDDLF
jgi:predicted PurR-regulated permease PerM